MDFTIIADAGSAPWIFAALTLGALFAGLVWAHR